MPVLAAIHCYPVKSCRGVALSRAELDSLGVRHDRAWMVVDEDGRFVTQREAPRLALVGTAFEGGALRLGAPSLPPLRLPLDGRPGPLREVRVWRHAEPAVDQGDEAADWFGAHLGQPVRLVRLAPDHRRRVNPERFPGEAYTAFSDGYPLLLLSTASLAELNRRLETPLGMERFRPNLVVEGCAPHAEDAWRRVRIGAVELALVKDCPRCVVTTVDPATGRRAGSDPLRTLARYRRRKDEVLFGRNAVHLAPGTLRVGDAVEVLERAEPDLPAAQPTWERTA